MPDLQHLGRAVFQAFPPRNRPHREVAIFNRIPQHSFEAEWAMKIGLGAALAGAKLLQKIGQHTYLVN